MSNLNLILKMKEVKKAEALDRKDVKELQTIRLKKLLKHVLNNSLFYKNYYQKYGIRKSNLDSVTLEELPFTNKKIIMDNFDDVSCDPNIRKKDLESFISNPENIGKKYRRKYQVIHTSGTTGEKGIFVYGPKDWELLKALVVTRVTKAKIKAFKRVKLTAILETRGNYAGISLVRASPKSLFDLQILNINTPLKEILIKINKFKPEIISGYASGIYLLALEQLKGNIDIKPQKVICSAELLTPKIKESIKEAFDLEAINFYAASESIGIGASCEEFDNFHIFNDWHCIEVVDSDLNYVEEGEAGNLVLTNLYNYTLPLIRYQMNDRVILDKSSCPCGSPFIKIKEIQGRLEDFLTFETAAGEKEYLHVSSIILMFGIIGIEKIQIVQSDLNNFIIKVVTNLKKESIIPLISKKMDEILARKNLETLVSYKIEFVKDIKNDPKTGKFKHIIPYQKTIVN